MIREEGSVEHGEARTDADQDDVGRGGGPRLARLTVTGTRALALAGVVTLAINETGLTRSLVTGP